MSTLLLRLEGPLQSWGVASRFGTRDTGLEPSKSGVIGLLAAALGRARDAEVSDLVALRMGVRVERAGVVRVDYHTAGGKAGVDDADYGVALFGSTKRRTVVSRRFYLSGASFLVGLATRASNQEALLTRLDAALDAPVWPLYLGRKAFVPAVPLRLPDAPPLGPGLRPESLEVALRTYPWPAPLPGQRPSSEPLRLVIEEETSGSGDSTGETRMDVPLSFAPLDRRYAVRYVRTVFLAPPVEAPVAMPSATPVERDPAEEEE